MRRLTGESVGVAMVRAQRTAESIWSPEEKAQ